MFAKKPAIVYDENIYRTPVSWDVLSEERIISPRSGTEGSSYRHVSKWTPSTAPTGIVIISHGLHEHGLRYQNVAHNLTSKGFIVYAIDHFAHGRSDGVRGLITDHTILRDDFIHLASHARSQHPRLPLSILAHSMGTLVVMTALQGIPDVKSVIFSGIALYPGFGSASLFGIKSLYWVSKLSIATSLLRMLSRMDPKGPAAPIIESELALNPAVLVDIHKDPNHITGPVMNKTGYELFLMTKAAFDAIPLITVPILCLHGATDNVTLPSGAQYTFDKAGTAADKKELVLFPGLKHEIFFEADETANKTIGAAADFLVKHNDD